MSIKIMTNVWQYSEQKGSALLLLLAIADNASDSGYAFPGMDYLARKTRLSSRQVIRLVQKLEETDELTVIRKKSHNEYIINVWPSDFSGIRCCERCGALDVPEIGAGLHKHHKIPTSQGGASTPENIEILCKDCHELHHKMEVKKLRAILSRDKMARDKMALLGDTHVTPDVTPMSPEPSLTINEPSFLENPKNPQNNGTPSLTQNEKDDLNILAVHIAKATGTPTNADSQARDNLKATTLLGYKIAQACTLIISIIVDGDPKTMADLVKVAISLYQNNVTREQLEKFIIWWYANTWQGQKGQTPTPVLIASHWGQFEASQTKPANDSGPTLTDEQKARLAELTAQDAEK